MTHWRTTFVPIAACATAIAALTIVGFTVFGTDDASSDEKKSPSTPFAAYSAGTSDSRTAETVEPVADRSDFGDTPATDDADQNIDTAEPPTARDLKGERLDGERLEDTEPRESKPAANGTHQGPTGRLVVITNFSRADVEVNGDSYPAYSDDLQNRGMELPAYDPHLVVVEYDGKEKIYEIELSPGERRMLMVELTGLKERSGSDRERSQRRRRGGGGSDEDVDDDMGRLTVYARPRGEIFVGGDDQGERAPGTIDIEPGRHQVQVEYENGEMSETKNVRVRAGSRVKLFFRQDD